MGMSLDLMGKEDDFWCVGTKKKERTGMYHLCELGILQSFSLLLLSLSFLYAVMVSTMLYVMAC